MKHSARIFVAGSESLIGSAIVDRLRNEGYANIVGTGDDQPDLTEMDAVESFFKDERPEYVFFAGGKSGGIAINQARPAELMLNNLRVITNVLDAAQRYGASKLLYLASSCAYPRDAQQPMCTEALGTGPVEPSSEAYATAKFAGWKLCQAYRRQYNCRFITGFPANAFGPNDDFEPGSGHVIASLIYRAHQARQSNLPVLKVWGTGAPRREFIFSRDLADSCVFVMKNYDNDLPLNLGGGTDLTIADVAHVIAEVVGFEGKLVFDASYPDGAPRKGLDSSRLQELGWRATTSFRSAVVQTYDWFLQHYAKEGATHACSSL